MRAKAISISAVGSTSSPSVWTNIPNLPGHDLNYVGADAKAFAAAMERNAGPLHKKVIKRVLVNGAADSDAPTAAHIEDALDMLRSAAANDTVMLFVSGHGVE